MRKSNGIFARWIIVAIAVATIAYNTITTHVISRNEIKHQGVRIEKLEEKIDWLIDYLMKK